MIVVPPCPDPWLAATERGAALPVVSSGWPGWEFEVNPRPPPEEPALAVGYDRGAAIAGVEDRPCDCGRAYCGSSRRSTAALGTEAVASGCEAKGLEKGFSERRVDMSPLQPAKPIDISASTATCGTRREQSNSTTRNMVTHSYATNYGFE